MSATDHEAAARATTDSTVTGVEVVRDRGVFPKGRCSPWACRSICAPSPG
jgi:hypothetical protein